MALSSSLTRVGIVGGGIGGLTLARILQLHRPRSLVFSIYESDRDPSVRATSGGSLDLKTDTGQRAMLDAGLHAEFLKLSRPVGEHNRVVDKTGKVLHDFTGSDAECHNPEIDRGQLRSLILDSLESNTVRWGHKATAVHRNAATGKYTIEFASGAKEQDFDIIVGAEGAWSKARNLVWPGAVPAYTGVTFLETKIDTAARPEFTQLVGQGAMCALGDGKGLLAQHNSGSAMMLYSALRVPEDWARTSPVALAKTPEEKLARMLEHFAGWDERLRDLVRAGENPTMRPIYTLPWDAQPRQKTDNIVLLGDAAHLMSPFAGMGVNLAMADAADLAKALISNEPLEGYEKVMRHRGNEYGEESAEHLELFFGDDAANQVAALFKSVQVSPGST